LFRSPNRSKRERACLNFCSRFIADKLLEIFKIPRLSCSSFAGVAQRDTVAAVIELKGRRIGSTRALAAIGLVKIDEVSNQVQYSQIRPNHIACAEMSDLSQSGRSGSASRPMCGDHRDSLRGIDRAVVENRDALETSVTVDGAGPMAKTRGGLLDIPNDRPIGQGVKPP
jgi:hypothetical protein